MQIFRYVTYINVNLSEPNPIVKNDSLAADAGLEIDFSINYN
jgi:hypothetical protein